MHFSPKNVFNKMRGAPGAYLAFHLEGERGGGVCLFFFLKKEGGVTSLCEYFLCLKFAHNLKLAVL